MEHRLLAVAVSSLVSQALLLFLLLSLPFSPSRPPPHLHPSLILHLLSSDQIAAAASLLPKNRKRHRISDSSPSTAITTNPDHFKLSFLMSSSTFEWLSGLLDPLLDCRGPPIPLSGPARLALALLRLSSGTPYADLATRFSVSEPAARFLSKQLCRVLCTDFRFWLAFPSPSDLNSVDAAFQTLTAGLPGCCGALSFARFGTRPRPVTAQIVADPSGKILSITAGFGSDLGVLSCSSLYGDAQAGRLLGPTQYFVGDRGYPLLPWLMVPFPEPPPGSCEEDFNAVHHSMIRPAIRAVSSLRNWRVLSRLNEEADAKTAVACVGTCAILHNVLLMREDYSALSDMDISHDCSLSSTRSKGDEGNLDGGVAGDKKALFVRSTLAVRARVIRGSAN